MPTIDADIRERMARLNQSTVELQQRVDRSQHRRWQLEAEYRGYQSRCLLTGAVINRGGEHGD